jgi:hypothetical protein
MSARQSAPSRPTTGQAPRRLCHGQVGVVLTPLGISAFNRSTAAAKWSQDRFPAQRGGFCMPGTSGAVTGFIAAGTAAVSATPADAAAEDGPLTSSPPSRGQSSGVALWRLVSPCFCYSRTVAHLILLCTVYSSRL